MTTTKVAALVGEELHSLVSGLVRVALADEDDFFVSDGVGCVAHRSMNVVTLECRVRVQEIGFGSALAQFPEDQLDRPPWRRRSTSAPGPSRPWLERAGGTPYSAVESREIFHRGRAR